MIPNIISGARLFAVPLLVYILVLKQYGGAAGLIMLCAFSDVLDGYLARRFHWETTVGILLDPIADKLLVMSALIYFYTLGFVPLWFICAVFYRDISLLVGLIALVWSQKKGAVPSNAVGKGSAALNVLLICFLSLVQVYPDLFLVTRGLFWMAALFVGLSFVGYSYRWFLLYDKKTSH